MRTGAARVEFRQVTKRYGAVTAVDDVSLVIEPGTLVTLLGPSGCGKTTMLRLIAGLETASAGRILIGDRDVTALSAAERDVSMVFQSYALFPHMSVLDNVAYGLVVSGTRHARAHAAARATIATVGLSGMEDRLPSELSGGQQQRVAVARALVLEPSVLLFDEPLSNLDARLRRRMREEIRELQRRLGVTVVYVTHDQEEALSVSDRIIVMNQAVIAQAGSPRELYEAPIDRFVATFMGDATHLQVPMVPLDERLGELAIGGLRVRRPHRGLPAGIVDVAIRPEAIRLSPPGGADGLEGDVVKCAYLGDHLEYTVATALGELFVTSALTDAPFVEGSRVAIAFEDRGITIVRP